MRELTKNQVAALREQYPVGSRIRLIQMNDPYHPVPPGTKGTLVAIDDLGTFHVNWDNGRGLGLVPGEDQFEVTPLETLKLYMPLSARIHERSEWGELDDWGTEMDSRDLLPYESQINWAMRDNDLPDEKTRGLMHWYEDKDGVNRKVHSAFFTVENRDGRLWGVAECKVAGTLEAEELETLRDYLAGQASDGWGEGFEQRPLITADRGELYVSLWNSDRWSILTEEERFGSGLSHDEEQTGGIAIG